MNDVQILVSTLRELAAIEAAELKEKASLVERLARFLHESIDYGHRDPPYYSDNGCDTCRDHAEKILKFLETA